MPYAQITYVQFRQQLAGRLSDSFNTFWTDGELKRWTLESLRTWSAYSTYWRERGVFNSVADTPFYDLTVQVPALLAYTVTDRDLVNDICYQLMEPPIVTWSGGWIGSEQFTLDDIVGAIQRRRDQFLSETGSVLTRAIMNAPSTPVGRIPLDDTVIDVRRCAWVDSGPPVATTPLFRADEYQLNAGMNGWGVNQDTPSVYSTIVSPPLTIQLGAVPLNAGQLDLLTVNSGASLDPKTGATILGIPDDFAWVVKWGALADLLGMDGMARDPDRASYCEERWKQGCELAHINPTIVNGEIQGVDNIIDDLWNVDAGMSDWQTTTGQPTVIATAGRNMMALANVPDDIYSVTADVVRNAIVPVNDGDFLQVGREVVDCLIDYAEHLAAFKMQGEEWKATNRAATNMMRQASIYNEKLKASALFKSILWPTDVRYEQKQPRRLAEATA